MHANIAKDLTFSPNQLERRTLYFEGDPADLVHTQNRFNMLQTVRAERATLSTAPLCTKGDTKNCYSSVKRVKAVIKRDYMEMKERQNVAIRAKISSRGTNVGSAIGSDDLRSDGVLDPRSAKIIRPRGNVKTNRLEENTAQRKRYGAKTTSTARDPTSSRGDASRQGSISSSVIHQLYDKKDLE